MIEVSGAERDIYLLHQALRDGPTVRPDGACAS